VGTPVHPAALAGNWRRILLVDALVGVGAVVLGAVAWVWWTPWAGVPLVVLGLLYVALVGVRYRAWRQMRSDHGLSA